MLTEREIKMLYAEHKEYIRRSHILNPDAYEFYKTRYDLLDFIVNETSVHREPPHQNTTLRKHIKEVVE